MKHADRPFIAIWKTTQACDLVCKHYRACARPERDTDCAYVPPGYLGERPTGPRRLEVL
jgi:MoaA/NifB/PqqE/SkfB family radical SAM enzyme